MRGDSLARLLAFAGASEEAIAVREGRPNRDLRTVRERETPFGPAVGTNLLLGDQDETLAAFVGLDSALYESYRANDGERVDSLRHDIRAQLGRVRAGEYASSEGDLGWSWSKSSDGAILGLAATSRGRA